MKLECIFEKEMETKIRTITAVFAFGVREGTGQCAMDKWVRVGTCFANVRNLVHEIVEGGWEIDKCVRCGNGALIGGVMESSHENSRTELSSGVGCCTSCWPQLVSVQKLCILLLRSQYPC